METEFSVSDGVKLKIKLLGRFEETKRGRRGQEEEAGHPGQMGEEAQTSSPLSGRKITQLMETRREEIRQSSQRKLYWMRNQSEGL